MTAAMNNHGCPSALLQSLEEGADTMSSDFVGRIGYLRDQFAIKGVSIVGLQETRSKRSETVVSGNFIRLCSGCTDTGQYGVEVWFASSAVHGRQGFRAEDLTVVYWSPRILCVKVQHAKLGLTVVSVHAPTAQAPGRDQWWQDLRNTLNRTCAGQDLVILGDCNIRLSQTVSGRIGDFTWESKYGVPSAFYGILQDHDLWVPSTFSGVHWGAHETWVAPGSTAAARIDYILLPCRCAVPEYGSFVDYDVDPGHKSVDHFAVCLDTWLPCRRAGDGLRHKQHLDRRAMLTREGREKISEICAHIPLQPWHVDVDTHYLHFQTHVQRELQEAFPGGRPKRAKTFLSEATWLIRDHRSWLRRQKSFTTAAAVTAWRQGGGLLSTMLRLILQLCTEARTQLDFVRQLRLTRNGLRQSIRRDRRVWLEQLASSADSLSVKDVVTRLRPLMRANGRKTGCRRALPAVMLEDGSVAATPQQARDRWIRHFAGIEGGQRKEPEELLVERREQMRRKKEPVHIGEGEIPSRVEIEQICLGTATGKAVGPDGLLGELLKLGAGHVSKPIYQLVLKMALKRQEPLLLKGGTLVSAWKHKGSPTLCVNHGALLISSVVSKTLHSAIRKRAAPLAAKAAEPMQVGGLPRYPVLFAAHAARLFMSGCGKGCFAMIFLDLREAFYRVARPFLSCDTPTDTQFASLFRDLQLPEQAYQEFQAEVLGGSILQKAEASEWMQAMMSEILSGTWFRMERQADIVQTTLGSRPGDCLADIVFYFIFTRVLADVRKGIRDVVDILGRLTCGERFAR